MFNFEKYNLKEMKDFFIEKAKNSRIEIEMNDVYFIGELSDSILGRGVEKTSFYFREYPEIVFKTFIGDCFSYPSEDLKYLYTSFNTENQIFADAKENNLSNFFVPSLEICKYKFDFSFVDDEENKKFTLPIVIQPKIDVYDYNVDNFHSSYSTKEIQDKYMTLQSKGDFSGFLREEFLLELLKNHSEEEVFNLVVFLEERGICDFHSENVGFLNDEFVILDYSM